MSCASWRARSRASSARPSRRADDAREQRHSDLSIYLSIYPSIYSTRKGGTFCTVTAEFYESGAYERARTFFKPHNALLARMVHYHKISIAGEAPLWLQNASTM